MRRRCCATAGYQVLDCIDAEGRRHPATACTSDAWRILHLAGHGVHEFPEPRRTDGRQAVPRPAAQAAADARRRPCSGMVIGQDTLLTPGDVEQMRWVPELVFINCCHLGKTQSARTRPRYNRLAANLGGAVHPHGGQGGGGRRLGGGRRRRDAFAESFYARLLAGEPFGEAVRAAREEVWTRFPDVNTWGAYQCYGDPGYRLRGDGTAPPQRGESATTPPAN